MIHTYIHVCRTGYPDIINPYPCFQIFDRLRNERPGFASQLVVVKGDVTLENLGLTREDMSLIKKKVSIIFHCAANVRFDQKLKNAVRYNTMGTRRVLELAEDIDNLNVSTGGQVSRVR
jgi:fatty acyl-CoA reductase